MRDKANQKILFFSTPHAFFGRRKATKSFMRKIIPCVGNKLQNIAQFRSVTSTIEHSHDMRKIIQLFLVVNRFLDNLQSKFAFSFREHFQNLPLNFFPSFQNFFFCFSFHFLFWRFLKFNFRSDYFCFFTI